MNALVTIMAHGESHAQQTFFRHLPFWRAHGLPILVTCPENSKVAAPASLPMLTIGRASHHDAEANRRFRTLLGILARTEYDRHIIFEYDSLCISPELPDEVLHSRGLFGNVFNALPGDARFTAGQYIHPPLIVDRETLNRLLESAPDVPDESEGGFWDRWLGKLCEVARVKPKSFGDLGYSQNTIEEHHLNDAEMAARDKAVFFHGVKTSRTLVKLRIAHNERDISCIIG